MNYIELKKGIFYWNQEVPIAEDAAEFERLIAEAGSMEDPEEKL